MTCSAAALVPDRWSPGGLAAQPGVTDVTAATGLLFFGRTATNVVVEGSETGPNPDGTARFDAIAPAYFEALGIASSASARTRRSSRSWTPS